MHRLQLHESRTNAEFSALCVTRERENISLEVVLEVDTKVMHILAQKFGVDSLYTVGCSVLGVRIKTATRGLAPASVRVAAHHFLLR